MATSNISNICTTSFEVFYKFYWDYRTDFERTTHKKKLRKIDLVLQKFRKKNNNKCNNLLVNESKVKKYNAHGSEKWGSFRSGGYVGRRQSGSSQVRTAGSICQSHWVHRLN